MRVFVRGRRHAGSLLAATVIAALPGTAEAVVAAAPAPLQGLENSLIAKINAVRILHGVRPLEPSALLATAARVHSRQMLAGGFFAHGAMWRRVTTYYRPRRRSLTVGENLVWATGLLSADHAVELWLQSPEHRENLLSPIWRHIGLGAAFDPAGRGVYGNEPVTVVTADFGDP